MKKYIDLLKYFTLIVSIGNSATCSMTPAKEPAHICTLIGKSPLSSLSNSKSTSMIDNYFSLIKLYRLVKITSVKYYTKNDKNFNFKSVI